MSKKKAPPAPDYSGIAAANQQAATLNYQLGKEQLAWAKESYERDSAVTNRVVDAALQTQAENNATALKDRQRYETQFQPLEDEFVAKAKNYNSPERSDADAAASMGDVSQQFNTARENSRKQLESYGVDPSQTRGAALDLSSRTQEAAARASAGNVARRQTEAMGNQMLTQAIDIGKGYPTQIATQYGTGTQSGNSAVSGTLQNTQTGAATMGTNTQYQALGNQGLAGWSGALTSGYNAKLAQYNANQNSSSGIGNILGTALGFGTKLATGGRFAEGGATEDVQAAIPVDDMGTTVTKEMSPSRGLDIDDVPAQLNAGEFVLPEDVTRWVGEKHLQTLITKSREEKQGAPAKPKVGAIPMQDNNAPRGALAIQR